jgi:hypothetical protein
VTTASRCLGEKPRRGRRTRRHAHRLRLRLPPGDPGLPGHRARHPETGAGADEIEAIGSRNGSGTTGITDLDALAGGFYSGQLIVIAGRAAMGTTTLALDILRSATLQQGLLAALFRLGCAAWN